MIKKNIYSIKLTAKIIKGMINENKLSIAFREVFLLFHLRACFISIIRTGSLEHVASNETRQEII